MGLIVEKAGVAPGDVVALVKYVRTQCPHLEFSGLMTIGSASASRSAQEEQKNPDFEVPTYVRNLTTDIEGNKGEIIARDTWIKEYRIKHGHERRF